MPTSCEIDFENNPIMVIYAGKLLRGRVKLNLSEEKNVRGVYLNINGKGYCHWVSSTGKGRNSHTGSENYLDEHIYFVGSTESGESKLLPGTYNYSFEYMLPPHLPTSFEGQFGHIRYTACVVLDIYHGPDETFEEPFTVIRAIDLNTMPELKEPVVVEKNHRFYLCCLTCFGPSNPLKIVARTPVGGYCPGQTINLILNVKNKSDEPVFEFSVEFINQITYHTSKDSLRKRIEAISILKKIVSGCDANQEDIIRVNMQIPPCPLTDVSSSNIVKVRYLIRTTGSVACCHTNPVLDLPITIGSYPIQDAPSEPLINTVSSSQPSAPLLLDQNTSLQNQIAQSTPPACSNDDPPTYEEALNAKNVEGNSNFKPKYPMFRRQTSYSIGD